MNKKLSLIILFLLIISLISVLLAYMSFSQGGNSDVGQLKTGYQQLSKQVADLKTTTQELGTEINGTPGKSPTTKSPSTSQTPSATTNGTSSTTNPLPSSNSTSTTTPVTTPTNTTKTITGVNVNMRAVAAATAKVVRTLSKGETVTLTGQTSTDKAYHWVQIKDTKGNTGWIVSSYVN